MIQQNRLINLGPERLMCNFFCGIIKNRASSNSGMEYRINSEFSTKYIPNRTGGDRGGNICNRMHHGFNPNNLLLSYVFSQAENVPKPFTAGLRL